MANDSSLVDLVKKMLRTVEQEDSAKMTAIDLQIDRHVYALYGLTAAEIALVEGAAEKP